MKRGAAGKSGPSAAERARKREDIAHARREKGRQTKTYLEAATQRHNSGSPLPVPTDPTQMPKVTVSGSDPYVWRPTPPVGVSTMVPVSCQPAPVLGPEPDKKERETPPDRPPPDKKEKEVPGPSYMRRKWNPGGPAPDGGRGKPDGPASGFPRDEVLVAPIVSKWKPSGPGPARPKTLDELNARRAPPGWTAVLISSTFVLLVGLLHGFHWSLLGATVLLSFWWLPKIVKKSWEREVRKNPEKVLAMRLAGKVEFAPWTLYGRFFGICLWTVGTVVVACAYLTGLHTVLAAFFDPRVILGFFFVFCTTYPPEALALVLFGLFMGGIAWPRAQSRVRQWFYKTYAFADCPQVTVMDQFGDARWEHHPALPSHEANVALLSDRGPTEYGVFQPARVRHYVDGFLIYEQLMTLPVTQVRNYIQNINVVAKNSLFARDGLDPNALREYVSGFVVSNSHALKMTDGDWVHTASYACVAVARAEAYRHFWSGPVILGVALFGAVVGEDLSRFNPTPLKTGRIQLKLRATARGLKWKPKMPIAVSLGCHVVGTCLQYFDIRSPINALNALVARLGRKLPHANRRSLQALRGVTRAFINANLSQVRVKPLNFEDWVEGTSYTGAQKRVMRELYLAMTEKEPRNAIQRELKKRGLPIFQGYAEDPGAPGHHMGGPLKDSHVGTFIKVEPYADATKAPRLINARSMEARVFFGPLIKAFEQVLYALKRSDGMPYFIKHTPVAERPALLLKLQQQLEGTPGSYALATDYSSFECIFTKELMDHCEFELYRSLVGLTPRLEINYARGRYSGLSDAQLMVCLFMDMTGGTNVCKTPWFTFMASAHRMSGEMNTSLGNGFANLMLLTAICAKKGSEFNGFVEGDDCIAVVDPHGGSHITAEDYSAMGALIKIEKPTAINEASFCGNVFAPQDLINVPDIRETIVKFGFYADPNCPSLGETVKRDLVRAKAMSMLAEYHGCPILTAMARWILRAVGAGAIRWSLRGDKSYWDAVVTDGIPDITKKISEWSQHEPGKATREMVERMQGISIADQLRIEHYFDHRQDYGPIPQLLKFKQEWHDNYVRLVKPFTLFR